MKNVTPRHGRNVPAMTTEKTRASPKEDGAKWLMRGMIASKGIFLLTSAKWNELNGWLFHKANRFIPALSISMKQ
jgi:hypothetical protein